MNNKIYHLRVEAYTTRFGNLKGKEPFYSELFFSYEEAWERGKERLHYMAQELFENSGYDSMEEFLQDKQIEYSWKIDEEFINKPSELSLSNDWPLSQIVYDYDFDGELFSRNFVWENSGSEVYRQVRENDTLPEAGTKFKIGDFIRLKRPRKTRYDHTDFENVFVVAGVPRRDDEGRLEENTYYIETVGKKGEYLWDWDWHFPFSGIHEDELEKYEGEIDKNSPLMFLRRIFLNEFKDVYSDEWGDNAIVRKLEKYEILLSPCLSWREIPELAALETEVGK